VSALAHRAQSWKQALLPDQMALFNVQLTEHLSGQFLYLFKCTRPNPSRMARIQYQ